MKRRIWATGLGLVAMVGVLAAPVSGYDKDKDKDKSGGGGSSARGGGGGGGGGGGSRGSGGGSGGSARSGGGGGGGGPSISGGGGSKSGGGGGGSGGGFNSSGGSAKSGGGGGGGSFNSDNSSSKGGNSDGSFAPGQGRTGAGTRDKTAGGAGNASGGSADSTKGADSAKGGAIIDSGAGSKAKGGGSKVDSGPGTTTPGGGFSPGFGRTGAGVRDKTAGGAGSVGSKAGGAATGDASGSVLQKSGGSKIGTAVQGGAAGVGRGKLGDLPKGGGSVLKGGGSVLKSGDAAKLGAASKLDSAKLGTALPKGGPIGKGGKLASGGVQQLDSLKKDPTATLPGGKNFVDRKLGQDYKNQLNKISATNLQHSNVDRAKLGLDKHLKPEELKVASLNGHMSHHEIVNTHFHHYHHDYWGSRSFFFGVSSPWGGYLGYPWYGYGSPRFSVGFYPGDWWGYYDPWHSHWGWGWGWGYSGWYYPCYHPYYYYQPVVVYRSYIVEQPVVVAAAPAVQLAAADQPVLAQADDVPLLAQKPADAPKAGDAPLADMPQPTEDELSDSMAFASQGETDFKAGNYRQAARNWRHSLVDDPRNGAVVMLLGQSLFAMGQYDEAAGAVQQGLRMLPDDKWGVVVDNYKELYPNQGLYTKQLRALEDARDAKPDSPPLRFLLGYHYAYLGYPQQALRELDKGIALAPKDEMAQKLREKQAGKAAPNESPVPRGGAAKEGAKAAAEEEGPALP